jgi:hypothetical protein
VEGAGHPLKPAASVRDEQRLALSTSTEKEFTLKPSLGWLGDIASRNSIDA